MARHPVPTVISISSPKISDEPTKNLSTVRFKFDMNVTEWRIKVLGTNQDSGVLADSGGIVLKDTEITAQIDNTELQQEGVNRLNVYGFNGTYWTPYDDASIPYTGSYDFGASTYGSYNYGKY